MFPIKFMLLIEMSTNFKETLNENQSIDKRNFVGRRLACERGGFGCAGFGVVCAGGDNPKLDSCGGIVDATPPCPTGFTCGPGTVPPGFGDDDTTFTYDSAGSNFAADVRVRLSEYEDNGVDFYNVDFTHGDNDAGIVGTTAAYWIDTTDPVGLNGSALGHVRIGPEASEVTKQIYDAKGGNLLLTLDSINGARDPLLGFSWFTNQQHLYVVDTIVAGTIESITNEYVPEPMSLSLFGIGLAALRFGRRRTA